MPKGKLYFLGSVKLILMPILYTKTNLTSLFDLSKSTEVYFQNPVEHLRWSFFEEIINSFQLLTVFTKKAPSQIFNWVLNMPLEKKLGDSKNYIQLNVLIVHILNRPQFIKAIPLFVQKTVNIRQNSGQLLTVDSEYKSHVAFL